MIWNFPPHTQPLALFFALLEPGKVASIYFYHYGRLGHPTLLMAWNAATPEFVLRGTLGCRDFDITEIDITESDVTETDITESDITESDVTESDIT